jgi:ethanolamine utilization protein EutA
LTAILDFYIGLLEAAVVGGRSPGPKNSARRHCQVEFTSPAADASATSAQRPIVTLSGGVGELAYRCARGEPLPQTTAFGDLGIDLARRICASPILGRDLTTHVPAGLGRATVYGLAVHSTEISGATLFLPHPELLPLTDLPILGSFSVNSTAQDLEALVALAARATAGACLQVRGDLTETATGKALGERLAAVLATPHFPAGTPLVLLVAGNIGKTLGQYATRWGRLPVALVVLDELPHRPAHFASIGRPCQNLIPVAFHGWEGRLDD